MGPPRRSRADYRLSGTFAMMFLASTLFKVMEFLSILFILGVGSVLVLLTIVFALDRRQNRDAILRNYPVIGHMRHILSKLGEFLRQYFFAMDRDAMRSIAQNGTSACVQIAPDRPSIAGAPANKRFGNGASHLKIDFKGVHQTGSTPQRLHRRSSRHRRSGVPSIDQQDGFRHPGTCGGAPSA